MKTIAAAFVFALAMTTSCSAGGGDDYPVVADDLVSGAVTGGMAGSGGTGVDAGQPGGERDGSIFGDGPVGHDGAIGHDGAVGFDSGFPIGSGSSR